MANVTDIYLSQYISPYQKKQPQKKTTTTPKTTYGVGSNATDAPLVSYITSTAPSTTTPAAKTTSTNNKTPTITPARTDTPYDVGITPTPTPTPTPSPVQPSATTTTGGGTLGTNTTNSDLTELINKLYQTQTQTAIDRLKAAAEEAAGNLKKSLTSSLSSLDEAQYGIGQTYYNKRNQAAAQSDVGAMNFAQYMASRGIKGSAAAMPEIYRNLGLQGALTSLNTSEAAENAAINRRRAQLQSDYQTDMASLYNKLAAEAAAAGNETEAARIQAQIAALKEEAEKAAQQQKEDRQAWLQTIGRFSDNYQAEIDRIKANIAAGDSSEAWKIPYLEAARVDKINAQKEAAAAAKAAEASKAVSTGQESWSRLDSDMQDIYNLYYDSARGGLTDEGRRVMYDYAVRYGGRYADQLLAKWGLANYAPTAITGSSSIGTGQSANFGRVADQAAQYAMAGVPAEQIANYLDRAVSQGLVSLDDAKRIARSLGLI